MASTINALPPITVLIRPRNGQGHYAVLEVESTFPAPDIRLETLHSPIKHHFADDGSEHHGCIFPARSFGRPQLHEKQAMLRSRYLARVFRPRQPHPPTKGSQTILLCWKLRGSTFLPGETSTCSEMRRTWVHVVMLNVGLDILMPQAYIDRPLIAEIRR